MGITEMHKQLDFEGNLIDTGITHRIFTKMSDRFAQAWCDEVGIRNENSGQLEVIVFQDINIETRANRIFICPITLSGYLANTQICIEQLDESTSYTVRSLKLKKGWWGRIDNLGDLGGYFNPFIKHNGSGQENWRALLRSIGQNFDNPEVVDCFDIRKLTEQQRANALTRLNFTQ